MIEDEKKEESDTSVVRGCLVVQDPNNKNELLLRIGNSPIQKIPSKCGVVGEFFDSNRAVNVVKNIFKDPVYNGEIDDIVLASCGVRVLPSWQVAAGKYQRGFMKTSNVMSRIKGNDDTNDNDKYGLCHAPKSDIPATISSLDVIPDIGVVGIPIGNRILLICAGEFDALTEDVVTRLSAIALSVSAALSPMTPDLH